MFDISYVDISPNNIF